MWRTMHIVAMSYPDEATEVVRSGYAAFYRSLTVVIPCPSCRAEYSRLIQMFPVEESLSCRSDLVTWTVKIHNEVSERIGKLPMTRDFVEREYVFSVGDSGVDPAVDRGIVCGVVSCAALAALIFACAWAFVALGRVR